MEITSLLSGAGRLRSPRKTARFRLNALQSSMWRPASLHVLSMLEYSSLKSRTTVTIALVGDVEENPSVRSRAFPKISFLIYQLIIILCQPCLIGECPTTLRITDTSASDVTKGSISTTNKHPSRWPRITRLSQVFQGFRHPWEPNSPIPLPFLKRCHHSSTGTSQRSRSPVYSSTRAPLRAHR